jgi:hypothetical protein
MHVCTPCCVSGCNGGGGRRGVAGYAMAVERGAGGSAHAVLCVCWGGGGGRRAQNAFVGRPTHTDAHHGKQGLGGVEGHAARVQAARQAGHLHLLLCCVLRVCAKLMRARWWSVDTWTRGPTHRRGRLCAARACVCNGLGQRQQLLWYHCCGCGCGCCCGCGCEASTRAARHAPRHAPAAGARRRCGPRSPGGAPRAPWRPPWRAWRSELCKPLPALRAMP